MSLEKKLSMLLVLLLVVALSSCKEDNPIEVEKNSSYIGQNLPGMVPVKFAPNSSYIANGSWWWQSSPSFSPDGKEMYFVKYVTGTEAHQIWFTKNVNGVWTDPQKASFSTTSFDSSPKFSVSSDTLYFFSTRPGGFIYMTTRISTGWSQPSALNIPLPQNFIGGQSFHIAKNKTVYFTLMKNITSDLQAMFNSADIYRSRFVNGQYTQPENLGASINSDYGEGVGYLDPDERFMILSSNRVGGYGYYDMYFSSKNQSGSWSSAVNLGTTLNSVSEDSGSQLTPDGKYLFFITEKAGDNGYSPYWVDAKILDPFK